MMTGAQVWKRLRAEGGFVHTMADGRQFVRFNRGYHPSRELVELLKSHREELKAFIIERHAEDDRLGWGVACRRGVGTPQPPKTAAPIGRDASICDCNAEVRLPVSVGSADFRPGRHRPVKSAAVSALVALLAMNFAVISEIAGGNALAVDFKMCAFYESSSGGGARVCLTSEANQTRGAKT